MERVSQKAVFLFAERNIRDFIIILGGKENEEKT
jgi:hypothetical protein